MGNGTLHSPTRISNNCNSVNSVNHVSEKNYISNFISPQSLMMATFFTNDPEAECAASAASSHRHCHAFVVRTENENPLRNILIQCLSVWVFELELVNVANVEMLPKPIPIPNWKLATLELDIFTLATFLRYSRRTGRKHRRPVRVR